MVRNQDNYERVDIHTLLAVLQNPDNRPDAHRNALSAVTQLDPLERTRATSVVMDSIFKHAGRYDQGVMEEIIDIMATDPNPDATAAMIEQLPGVLRLGIDGKDDLKPAFREYYYSALLTRQRDEDVEIWAEMLPEMDPTTYAAMLIDPVGGKLVTAIDPLTLIDRSPEPQRSAALWMIVRGIIRFRGSTEHLQQAVKILQKSSDTEQTRQAVEELTALWEKLRKADHRATAAVIEKVLRIFDREPRNAMERLRGKRPWAP